MYLESIRAEKTTFSTLYGAIYGIAELGDDVINTMDFNEFK